MYLIDVLVSVLHVITTAAPTVDLVNRYACFMINNSTDQKDTEIPAWSFRIHTNFIFKCPTILAQDEPYL